MDLTVNSVTALVAASCIPHNICELRRDNFLAEWLVGDTHEPPNDSSSFASDIRDSLHNTLRQQRADALGPLLSE